jgi:hypothetical protein
MLCLYSLDFRLPSRLFPFGPGSHANLSSCPSIRTLPLAPTLFTHSAVKADVPNCVGVDHTDHMPGGLSAFKSAQHPMFFRLRRYREYFAHNPSRAWVCYVSMSLPERSLCSRSFPKSLLTQDGARCRCQSRMSHLGPGGSQSASLILCCGNDDWGLPRNISARLQRRAS